MTRGKLKRVLTRSLPFFFSCYTPPSDLSENILEDLSPLIRLIVPDHISTSLLPLDVSAAVIRDC